MRIRKLLRVIAIALCINMVGQICFPTLAFALTDGPNSPEFTTFQPVGASDMVNTFTGDFSYNLPVFEIPGPDGAGYALSLSYQSGASCEDEASWVGFGWTLNPGSILRTPRGFPDEYNGEKIYRYNKSRPNFTVSRKDYAVFEWGSLNAGKKTSLKPSVNLSNTVGFNNYTGHRYSFGGGISFGIQHDDASLGGNVGISFNNSIPEGITFPPILNLSITLWKGDKTAIDPSPEQVPDVYIPNPKPYLKPVLVQRINRTYQATQSRSHVGINVSSATYGLFSFNSHGANISLPQQERARSRNWKPGLMFPVIPGKNSGPQVGRSLSYSYQLLKSEEIHTAHGYIYTPNDGNSLSDSYIERGSEFDPKAKYLGIPFNNADYFFVQGEGIGGSFRYYPDRVGIFQPLEVKN
jgi:hypothetical protein